MDKLKLNFEDQDGNPKQDPDLNPPSVVIPPTDPPKSTDSPTEPPTDPSITDPELTDDDEIVEIDGKEYTIDKDGNATLDGKVVYSVDKLKELEQSSEEDYIASVEAKTGIKVFDEEGQEIKYENSVEGFIQREIDVFNQGKQMAIEEVYTNLYSQHPEIKQLLMYKELYGDLKNFKFDKNYSNRKFIEGNEENNISLVREELSLKGLNDEDIDLQIDALKMNNKLSERAKNSEKYLIEQGKRENSSLETAIAEKRRKQIEQQEDYYGVTFKDGVVIPLNKEGSVYDKVVEKGKIGNYDIPITGITFNKNGKIINLTRKQIFDYISVARENGLSQAQIDDRNYTQNMDNLLLRYLSHLLGKTVDKTINPTIQKRKKRIISSSSSQGKIKLNYN